MTPKNADDKQSPLNRREAADLDRWRRNSGAKRKPGAPKGNTNAMTHGIYVSRFLSEDEGQTWYGGLLLDGRTGVSYPDGVQAPDGRIYVIYDYSRTGEREILMARYTEQDVAEGRRASDAAELCILVNKARPEA